MIGSGNNSSIIKSGNNSKIFFAKNIDSNVNINDNIISNEPLQPGDMVTCPDGFQVPVDQFGNYYCNIESGGNGLYPFTDVVCSTGNTKVDVRGNIIGNCKPEIESIVTCYSGITAIVQNDETWDCSQGIFYPTITYLASDNDPDPAEIYVFYREYVDSERTNLILSPGEEKQIPINDSVTGVDFVADNDGTRQSYVLFDTLFNRVDIIINVGWEGNTTMLSPRRYELRYNE